MPDSHARSYNQLFAVPWNFLYSIPTLDVLPAESLPEVSFLGRSNVGKSSLINILVNQKKLAKTSSTPGCTQYLNYFTPDLSSNAIQEKSSFFLVDMPGYGYAKSSKKDIKNWRQLVFSYLKSRRTLRRTYILIDARHGIKESDENIFSLLDESAVCYQIVLTKTDYIKSSAIECMVDSTLKKISKHSAVFPEIIYTSAREGIGLDALRQSIICSVMVSFSSKSST